MEAIAAVLNAMTQFLSNVKGSRKDIKEFGYLDILHQVSFNYLICHFDMNL